VVAVNASLSWLGNLACPRGCTELRVEGMPRLNFANWAITRDGMYFYPADDNLMLSYFDFSTRRVRPIFKVNGPSVYGLSVSPDERYILYTEIDDRQSDIKLVENFH
jgi:hypothetical protein